MRFLGSRLLDIEELSNEVNSILSEWIGPLFIAIGGVAAVYVIVLAVQLARAENDSKKAEVRSRFVNTIIGMIAILIIGAVSITVDWAGVVQIFGYAGKV